MKTRVTKILIVILALALIALGDVSYRSAHAEASRAAKVEARGVHGAVAAGHQLTADVGLAMLKRGGNAIDAGLAMVLAASVVEFENFGFAGEMPTLIFYAPEGRVFAINGNTRAPQAANIEWFKSQGYKAIPGDGFLPAGVPAVPASLVLTLDRFGTLSFAEIAKDAIRLAEEGFPVDQRWRDSLVGKSGPHSLRGFLEQWPTSAKLFLNDGALPELGEVTRNPELGQMLRRLVDAERRALAAGASRKVALRAVHEYFYKGPIAREIVDFTREFRVKDAEGGFHHGLLALEDFAKFEARVEEPWTLTYRGYQVHKCGPWTQGPVFLQQLALLEGYDLKGLGHNSVDYLHLWFETAKLAHADKEKYYGDPDFVYVPKQGLLSKKYAAVRRKLIDLDRASTELRPGDPFPFDEHPDRRPTVLKLGRGLRDHGTTGIRSVDSKGNMFTATASGGWFYDSPIVPGLGIALGTRIQMFYLDKGLAKSLAPGKQPSTSLTPTLVLRDGQPFMAFGMPGGDWQDQGTLQFFLNVVDFGMGVQEALDAPKVWTDHFPSLFYPHRSTPGHAGLEKYFPDLQKIVSGLSQKGHKVDVRAVPLPSNWHGADNTMVVVRDPRTGTFLAATNPRMPFSTALAW